MLVLDDWLLTPARAAIHVPSRTAVIADLHLGYGRMRQRSGEAVPGRGPEDELQELGQALARLDVSRLVVAGDLLEDGRYHREEVLASFCDWLTTAQIELVAVVPGNHDRGLVGTNLPVRAEGMILGEWTIVHGDAALPAARCVQGHEHPHFRWRPGVEGRCFLVRRDHLILPAWSPDAAGGNVLGNSRWASYRACVIAGETILDFGEVGKLSRGST